MNKLFMLMLVVLLCGVSIIFVVAASSPEWIQVNAKSKSFISNSYLPSSLSGKERIKNLWLKASYNDKSLSMLLDQNKDYIDAYSHSFLRVKVDCERSRYVLLEEHNKSTKGYTLTSLVLSMPQQFTKISPGTAEDTWKNYACTNNGIERIVSTLKTLFKSIY